MNTIRVVGIDIAKSVFQVCVWISPDGSVAAHVASLRCISLIIKALHLIGSVNSLRKHI